MESAAIASVGGVSVNEGLKYVGGYIVKKFPQYSFLGTNIAHDDSIWTGEICRSKGKLMTPSNNFLADLKIMENVFVCFHEQTGLKAGRNSLKNLSSKFTDFVKLPRKVIDCFAKCRLFFRIRKINRTDADAAVTITKQKNKMDKL